MSRTARGRHARERENRNVPYETKPTLEESDTRHRLLRAFNKKYCYLEYAVTYLFLKIKTYIAPSFVCDSCQLIFTSRYNIFSIMSS